MKLFSFRTGQGKRRNLPPAAQDLLASGTGVHCPFVDEPFFDCYIMHMNSQNIDRAINYCGNHFEECEIYRKRGGGTMDHAE